jgi:3-hydroxyisobutyrate dehydrogenase/2-hydroxy-3-oxopropionate reductase
MGLPMTRHLLEAGHQVTVSSRSPGPIAEAVSLGAVEGASPAEVARAGDVAILCVPSSPQVAAVVDASP